MSDITFGYEYLDAMYSNVFNLNPLIIIAGDPGAGKTAFACTMCYVNALRGNKCLYITFYEDKDKLFSVMSGLGVNLSSVESKGLFRFVKLPTAISPEFLGETILKIVDDFKPKVLVLDSITPILIPMKTHAERRSVTQNFLYELPNKIKGTVVLIAESLGHNKLKYLGDAYFIADVLFIMRNITKRELPFKVLEIRKARGCEVKVSEIPYTISSGKGIELRPKPLLEEIPKAVGELKLPCKMIKDVLEHLHLGMAVYITYHPDNRPLERWILLTSLLVLNNLKCLYISYNHPPDSVREQIVRIFKKYGVPKELAEAVVDKYYTIMSINPFIYDLRGLLFKVMELVEKTSSDAVVYDDVSMVGSAYSGRKYLTVIYDNLNFLKSKNKLIVRIGSYIDEERYRLNAMLSDVVIRFEPTYRGDAKEVDFTTYVWGRGRGSALLKSDDLKPCIEECAQNIILYWDKHHNVVNT